MRIPQWNVASDRRRNAFNRMKSALLHMAVKKSLFSGIFEGFALAFFFLLRYSPMRPGFFAGKQGYFHSRLTSIPSR